MFYNVAFFEWNHIRRLIVFPLDIILKIGYIIVLIAQYNMGLIMDNEKNTAITMLPGLKPSIWFF